MQRTAAPLPLRTGGVWSLLTSILFSIESLAVPNVMNIIKKINKNILFYSINGQDKGGMNIFLIYRHS